ncbi:unnamed protein product [Dovyalis caffra]|uniref:Uncharacterized protein n=1 Tax=Dovyalis caffra TaxID=77055 RepID=A0AAV1RW77_9ROSI|nr:unnamed protein product [Dovyalis caffra]
MRELTLSYHEEHVHKHARCQELGYMEMEWDEMMKRSEDNNRYGKVSWILNKGLSVGKMILVTGFVISSAPVILPPLVVISAIGFACSLPYGLFLGTYAFTGQLMAKLLPTPNSNLFLECNYGTNFKDITVVDEKQLLDDQVEENGYEEDVEDQSHKPPSKVQEAKQEKTVIEQGREGVDGASQVTVIINEAGDEGSGSNILKDDGAPFESVTTGILIEKIRDEGKVDDEALQEEIIKQSVENVCGEVDKEEIGQRNVHESGRNDKASMEERSGVIGQVVEENVDKEIPLQSEEVKEMVSSAVLMEMQPIQDVRVLLEKKDVEDSTKGRAQRNIAHAKQDPQLTKEKELLVIPPNEDAREIADESGLHLFDDKQAVGLQCSYSDYRITEAGIEHSSYEAYEVTLPTTVDDSKCTGIPDIHLAAGNGKVLYGEDKIWKQIHAMRKIVGYRASVRATCIEELKALYVFTGVDPPASFKDPSDLVEVNDQLRFLMTIVGVK